MVGNKDYCKDNIVFVIANRWQEYQGHKNSDDQTDM
jgi:hypothetical protein